MKTNQENLTDTHQQQPTDNAMATVAKDVATNHSANSKTYVKENKKYEAKFW